MLPRAVFAASAAILLALAFFASSTPVTHAQDHGCDPDYKGGLLQDCGFVDFYGNRGAGSGAWKVFKLSGTSGIALHMSEGWPKGPSVWIKSTSPYDAGIYQQVSVTPGKGYHFVIPFAVISINGQGWHDGDQVNRRLGIDPFGGTDANSPNVAWSSDYFGKAKVTEAIEFDQYARASTITVFIRVQNPYEGNDVDVFLDSPALIENTGMPPIEIVAPTVTPPPPPPTAVPPTSEPVQQPTDVPAPTDPPPATEEPVIEPTATASVQPTDPPRPSRTRVAQVQPTTGSTRTRVAVARSSAPDDAPASAEISPVTLGAIGAVGLLGITGALLLVGAAAFLLLRRK